MKTHLRMGKRLPYSVIAICGHNTKTSNGVSSLVCSSPKEFSKLPEYMQCKHCKVIFDKKVRERQERK